MAEPHVITALSRKRAELAGDIEVLPSLAEAGLIAGAKDVSMTGVLGSLAMLLEPSRCGALVDLEAIPRPDGIGLALWTSVFPTYAFVLTASPDDAADVSSEFRGRGLACERIGTIDDTGRLRVRLGPQEAELLDLKTQAVTGLASKGDPGSRQ